MKKSLKKFITTAGLGLSLITPSFSQNTEKIISNTKNNLTQVLDYDTTKHQEIINTPIKNLDKEIILKAMLYEINNIRKRHNINPLKYNSSIEKAANQYAKYIYDHQWFQHIDKNGVDLDKRLEDYGYNGIKYGENMVAWGETIKKATDAWMKSKHHKENLLLSEYEDTGIGLYYDPKSYKSYNYIRVQDFGKPKQENKDE